MSMYTYLPESVRVAVNRLSSVFTEKEKRVFNQCFEDVLEQINTQYGSGFIKTDGSVPLTGYIDFTPSAAPAHQEGRVWYDETDHALNFYNEEVDMIINLAEENVVRVRNVTGQFIPDGKVVYISGSTGEVPQVTKATASPTHTGILGVATHDISNNGFGYVTTFGTVRGIDTSGIPAGTTVYLSPITAGDFTATKPTYPDEAIEVGYVVKSAASGKLFVNINHEYMEAVLTDTSPELGGDLYTNSHNIVVPGYNTDGVQGGAVGASDWMWADKEGPIQVRGVGVTDPTWSQIAATVFWGYKWAVNDECWLDYHIPHDIVPGSDIHVHCHWLSDGTDVANTVKWEVTYAFAKGFSQAAFNLASPGTITYEAVSGGQYSHNITESAAITIPTMTEPDGVLKVRIRRITNGATDTANGIFMNTADLHYQSTGIGTVGKAPAFYNTP